MRMTWDRRELLAWDFFALETLVGWCRWHRWGDVAIALLLGSGGLLRAGEWSSDQ